jgi:hypothetical protein
MSKKFVISSTEINNIMDAENIVSYWSKHGKLKRPIGEIKLFKVVETYDLRLKFIKRK